MELPDGASPVLVRDAVAVAEERRVAHVVDATGVVAVGVVAVGEVVAGEGGGDAPQQARGRGREVEGLEHAVHGFVNVAYVSLTSDGGARPKPAAARRSTRGTAAARRARSAAS